MRHIQSDNTVNVIHSSLNDTSTRDLFFGPLTNDEFVIFDDKSLARLLVQLELAPSFTWCKKNGWDRQIKSGFQEVIFGKSKIRLFILSS